MPHVILYPVSFLSPENVSVSSLPAPTTHTTHPERPTGTAHAAPDTLPSARRRARAIAPLRLALFTQSL